MRISSEKYRIGKVHITVTNPIDTLTRVEEAVKDGRSGYVCVSNMRTVKYANKNADYCKVMNEAFMCIPDGMPLVWLGHLWGIKEAQRSNGPTLFESMLNKPENGVKHFLLGDTDETLNALKARYPKANIVGMISPPFCELDEFDYKGLAKKINESGANVLWVSMRAPKQDFFSSRIIPYLDSKISIGVGRAFRIAIGEFTNVPKWMQKFGLSGIWLRKVSLWDEIKWYIVMSFFLVGYGIGILMKRVIGKKCYE